MQSHAVQFNMNNSFQKPLDSLKEKITPTPASNKKVFDQSKGKAFVHCISTYIP